MDENQILSLARGLRREAVLDHEGNLVIERGSVKFVTPHEEIKRYFGKKDQFRRDYETQLYYPGRYEHVVQFEGARPTSSTAKSLSH